MGDGARGVEWVRALGKGMGYDEQRVLWTSQVLRAGLFTAAPKAGRERQADPLTRAPGRGSLLRLRARPWGCEWTVPITVAPAELEPEQGE
jgi:hypothetical protein